MQREVGPDMLPGVFICPECRTVFDERGDGKCDRDGSELAEVLAHQTKARYPLLGQVVGDRYHLIGGLGQGGLGTVYLAHGGLVDTSAGSRIKAVGRRIGMCPRRFVHVPDCLVVRVPDVRAFWPSAATALP